MNDPINELQVNLIINGRPVSAPPSMSVIESAWHSGYAQVEGIGCMQGVCGTCRIMVRRKDSPELTMELACETMAEEGMQVNYISFQELQTHHHYRLQDFQNIWDAPRQIQEVFPEAADCRHCGGCDAACPKGIDVQRGVELAAGTDATTLDPVAAGRLFDQCVMCNLCTHACPENIAPNHLAQLVRRMSASMLLRPTNLMARLEQIRKGEMYIEDQQLDLHGGREPAAEDPSE